MQNGPCASKCVLEFRRGLDQLGTVAGKCHRINKYKDTLQSQKTSIKILTTHFKILATHFKIVATHYEILTTHFKILTTHFKKYSLHILQSICPSERLPSNVFFRRHVEHDAMFCSSCGNELEEAYAFCPTCGRQVGDNTGPQDESNSENEREAIESYFFSGYEYKTVISFLSKYHDINISLSTLKRRLDEYGLKRKNSDEFNDENIAEIVQQELDGPGCVSGYRSMWHTLRLKHGLCVPRDKVQRILKELDPDGTEERKRHRLKRRVYTSNGPNECWHVDGYDKLKPFGFPIHVAIDGYSRRVLWLKVRRSNNNPIVIANHYLECVKELGGFPCLLRCSYPFKPFFLISHVRKYIFSFFGRK